MHGKSESRANIPCSRRIASGTRQMKERSEPFGGSTINSDFPQILLDKSGHGIDFVDRIFHTHQATGFRQFCQQFIAWCRPFFISEKWQRKCVHEGLEIFPQASVAKVRVDGRHDQKGVCAGVDRFRSDRN